MREVVLGEPPTPKKQKRPINQSIKILAGEVAGGEI